MNSRDAQDVILRLLADGPYRSTAMGGRGADAEVAAVLARVDLPALDRFGRFLCRHYYRERVVHYFKYCRALAPLVGRSPEAALKTEEFKALMPGLILGERASAQRVLDLLRRFLTADAEPVRAKIPYWDDLIAYQGAFFLSDAVPSAQPLAPFPARAETTQFVELGFDLPAVLPRLLRPFEELPMPLRTPVRLLLARSQHGEVTAIRCSDTLKTLLDSLTGEVAPAQVAARLGVDAGSFERTLRQLESLGAVVAQESFSSSHVGSDLPAASAKG
ncbi:MAG: hypothetical protein LAP13_01890 [Acidobacteriia bacterium]|nr:hypothetical protein [Terriglobia bacterium]